MKVCHHLPDIDITNLLLTIELTSDEEVNLEILKYHQTYLVEIRDWLNSVGENFTITKVDHHKDFFSLSLKCAICLEMKEDIATLFRLRFS